MSTNIYILGGYQTDFARNWNREQLDIFALFQHCLSEGFAATAIAPEQVEVAHVGNFVSSLFTGQAHLGGFFAQAFPEMSGIPTSRHEAACASGSMAILGAMRDIEAGHYGLACVLGIELMRNVNGATGADHLASAAWRGHEGEQCSFLWPHMFSRIVDEYDQRYGIDAQHLRRIAEINFANARRNPNAQTRAWTLESGNFSDDEQLNPVIEGHLRKQDCGQITDGAAVVFLADRRHAQAYADQHGLRLDDIPMIKGWGHRTAALSLEQKLIESKNSPLIFPHVRHTFDDALRRAAMNDIYSLDSLEVHDCFTATEYMIIDHAGLTPPGESWRAIENDDLAMGGRLPINPSGGLIGLGHPVGATGVRMLLDSYKQVTGQAGSYQVENARNVGVFNLGGSAATCATFIVGR